MPNYSGIFLYVYFKYVWCLDKIWIQILKLFKLNLSFLSDIYLLMGLPRPFDHLDTEMPNDMNGAAEQASDAPTTAIIWLSLIY